MCRVDGAVGGQSLVDEITRQRRQRKVYLPVPPQPEADGGNHPHHETGVNLIHVNWEVAERLRIAEIPTAPQLDHVQIAGARRTQLHRTLRLEPA